MATTTDLVLEVHRLSVQLGGAQILADVSLSIAPGELVGLIGPNGSGKTTLLRAVGALVPSEGQVWLTGSELHLLSPRGIAQRAARVAQATLLDPALGLSVEEVVLAGRAPHLGRWHWEGRRDHEIAGRAMRRTASQHLAERLVAELSGGERQRVYLARALAQEPRLLLLDEPTANLDLGHQVRVLGLVKQLVRDAHLASIAAIHDLELAARFCDRLILLDRGRVAADGPPARVLTPPRVAEVFGVRVTIEPEPQVRGLRITVLDDADTPAASTQ
jgi:iron complex transport system ATP-binding protein